MPETTISIPVGIPQVVIEREFAAPPELVRRAHLDPALLVQWLGPRELTLVVDRFEPYDAGRWRYVHRDAAGHEYGFHGVFHGDPSVASVVQTFEFEGAPGHVKLDTTTFEEGGAGTLLRVVSSFQSVEDRDAMVASGMERGLRDSAERLEELFAAGAPVGRA